MRHSALGLVEVRGYLGAVASADAALKAANVTCIGVEIIKGGLVTVMLDGDVGAVQAAVEAGADMAKQLDVLVTRHVIARMHEDTAALVAGPVDAHESERQVEKSITKDFVDDNVKHSISKESAVTSGASESMKSVTAPKVEAIKAVEAPKPEVLSVKSLDNAEPNNSIASVESQAKAESVSTVVSKEAGEVKPGTEQTVAAVKTAAPAPAEKQIGIPKGQQHSEKPRVQPTHTPSAKSSKKTKKASS